MDLKNPGRKEYLIFGGTALGLALLYFYLNRNKTSAPAAGTPAQTGATPASPVISADGAPISSGINVAGGPFTGNALTDAVASAPPPGPGRRPSGPPVRLPVLHASQGAGEVLGGGGGSSAVPSPSGGGGGSNATPSAATVYNALVKQGLLPFQAAGVLGNIQNESTFNPEAVGDSGTSFGLIQWHNTTYPNAAAYVTGNAARDFKNQITAIVQLFRQHNIGGTTAGQVAGNWASQVEGCVGCQPGGSQYNGRVFNAILAYQNAIAGRYAPPKVAPKTSPKGGVKAATPGQVRGLLPMIRPAGFQTKVRRAPVGLASRPAIRNVVNAINNAFRVPKARPKTPAVAGHPGMRRVGLY